MFGHPLYSPDLFLCNSFPQMEKSAYRDPILDNQRHQ